MSLLSRIAAVGIMTVVVAAAPQVQAQAPPSSEHAHKKSAVRKVTAPVLNADGSVPDAVTEAGVESQVAHAYDCAQPNHAPVLWARADHGTTTVKTVTTSGCGRASISQAGVFYKSEPGFKGTDKLYMLGYITNGKLDYTYTILVR